MIISNIDGLKQFSHKEIIVKCDGYLSDKCLNEWKCKLSEISVKRKRNNTNKDYCFHCYAIYNQGGTKSHFNKYYKNDLYFSNINSEDKAYFLGWIASDGHVRRKRFTIKISDCDSYILNEFSQRMQSNIPVHHKRYDNSMWSILDVSSMKMTADLSNLLNINYGAKDFTVCLPKLDDKLMWHFIRGLFEGDGHIPKINSKAKRCKISIASVSNLMKKELKNFLLKFNIIICVYKKTVAINGINAVKFIKNIYDQCDPKLCLLRKKEVCLLWKEYLPQTKKLDMQLANEIRKLHNNGSKIKELAGQFSVSKNAIHDIINNISYKIKGNK